MAEVNLVEAVNLALAYELEHDPDVIVLGEDIGVNGGVFRATVGLEARFGAGRIIDTPLAESAAGSAVSSSGTSGGASRPTTYTANEEIVGWLNSMFADTSRPTSFLVSLSTVSHVGRAVSGNWR